MSNNIYILLFNGFLMLIYGAMNIFNNVYLNEEYLFGHRVEGILTEEELRGYKLDYIKESSLVGGIALLLLGSIPYFLENRILFILSPIGFILVFYILYIRWNIKLEANKKINPKRRNKIEVEVKEDLETISLWYFLIPIFIVLFNILIGAMLYNRLPEKLPTSWDISGNVSGQMDKTFSGVFLMPLFQLGVVVVIFAVFMYLRKSKKFANPNNPDISMMKNLIYRRVWSYYLMGSLIMTEILLTVLNLMTLGLFDDMKLFNIINSIVVGIILMGGILLILVLGHGGDNLRIEEELETTGKKIDEKRFWKLGNTIYINNRNPSIFINDKTNSRLVINIGRPIGVVLKLYPLVVVIIALVLNS